MQEELLAHVEESSGKSSEPANPFSSFLSVTGGGNQLGGNCPIVLLVWPPRRLKQAEKGARARGSSEGHARVKRGSPAFRRKHLRGLISRAESGARPRQRRLSRGERGGGGDRFTLCRRTERRGRRARKLPTSTSTTTATTTTSFRNWRRKNKELLFIRDPLSLSVRFFRPPRPQRQQRRFRTRLRSGIWMDEEKGRQTNEEGAAAVGEARFSSFSFYGPLQRETRELRRRR